MTWPIFIVWRKRYPKTSLLTSAVVRLVFFAIDPFFTILDLLMFLGMGSKNFFDNNWSRSLKNSFAIVMPSFCRFTSLVGLSASDPELRFINMVLSSAVSNGLTNWFSKTATTFDLRDSDFRIYEGHKHISSKEFNFWAWSALPMVHLVTLSLSAENLLTPPMVLASLFSDCSPRWSTAIWKLHLACHLRSNREDDLIATV